MKSLSVLLLCAVAAALVLASSAGPVRADKAFRDEFIVKYVKPDSSDAKDAAFAAEVKKANCNVCHEGKSKKNRNAYGKALAKFLSRETDKEDKPKIQASLDKVAAMKCDPSEPNSPTFGDRIKERKLPGANP